MNRFEYYQNNIVNKLLLSKFVYPTTKKKMRLLRTIIAALPDKQNQEMSAFGLVGIYGRIPSVSVRLIPLEGTIQGSRIVLTAQARKSLSDLQLLVNKIIPFQIENALYFPALSPRNELNWRMSTCTLPNDMNYLFIKYPVSDNTFVITVQLRFSTVSITEAVFYARLFQLPVDHHVVDKVDVSQYLT